MAEQEKWEWQKSGTAWRGIGVYHITLTVPSREPLFGTLVIPENNPTNARIERTALGNAVVDELYVMCRHYPAIRILQFCLMPDHLHAVIHVTKVMETSIRSVVRGYWQGVNRRGQLHTMIRYVQMNPQRLATKRLKPGYFRVQKDIVIGERKYDGVGNVALLLEEGYDTVHVRSVMVKAAEHSDVKELRDYMNSRVLLARKGVVMVSPFISPQEKLVMQVLLQEQHPIILLTDNGFRDYYKPADTLFDACAAGRLLILSPWPYDEGKRHISRSECVALNAMAEEICQDLNGNDSKGQESQ